MNINCDTVFDQDNLPQLNEEMNFTGEDLYIYTLIDLHGLNGFDAVPRLVCMIKDNNGVILDALRECENQNKGGLAIDLFSRLPIQSKINFVFSIRNYSNIRNLSPTLKTTLIKSIMNNANVNQNLIIGMISNGNF